MAGTAVLGTRLAVQDYHVAAAALLVVAGVGCSFATGQVTGISGIADFGRGWTWVAFTVSLLVFGGLLRHSWPVLRGQHHPAAAEDGA